MSQKLKIASVYLKYKNKHFRTREALRQYQEKHIRKHLKFVATHSKFYSDYLDKPLSEFPVMDKKSMMAHFNELNTVGVDKEEALDFAIGAEKSRDFNPTLNKITVGLSSGTSDTRGVFLVSDEEKNIWAGYILSKVLYGSLLGSYEVAFFMRANSNLYESVGGGKIHFTFYDIYESIEDNIKKLEAQKPDILVGQPSVLVDLCKYNTTIHPKKIISIAEVLEDSDRERIMKAFGVDVIHQVYQCTEGCLATTCDYGTIHMNEDIVFVEKEYLDEQRFIPIITDYTRTSQPIIRYRLNDILVERNTPCPCGSHFLALDRIEGREDDVFVFDGCNGQIVKVFPDFIRRVVLFAGDIKDYRILQNEDGSIDIFMSESEDMRDRILKEFEKLATDRNFILPEIKWLEYGYDHNKKLKRVESRRKIEDSL